MDKHICPWCGEKIHTVATIDFSKVAAVYNELYIQKKKLQELESRILYQRRLHMEETATLYRRKKELDRRESTIAFLLVDMHIRRKRKKKPLIHKAQDLLQSAKEQINEFWHGMEKIWYM